MLLLFQVFIYHIHTKIVDEHFETQDIQKLLLFMYIHSHLGLEFCFAANYKEITSGNDLDSKFYCCCCCCCCYYYYYIIIIIIVNYWIPARDVPMNSCLSIACPPVCDQVFLEFFCYIFLRFCTVMEIKKTTKK